MQTRLLPILHVAPLATGSREGTWEPLSVSCLAGPRGSICHLVLPFGSLSCLHILQLFVENQAFQVRCCIAWTRRPPHGLMCLGLGTTLP